MSLISVITPAYNRERTIEASLDSLLAQSLSDWETIVVDDGSSDRTAEIVEGYARRDHRFRLHRQANAGVSAARNAALALAASPWTLFLDADDWISPDALELLSAAAAAHPDAMLVHGGCVRLLPSGAEVAEADLPPPEELFETFARTCVFSIHTCLVRTDLVRSVGGFDESLTTSEDWDLWQRIVRTGHTPVQIPQKIAYYRVRLGSASRNPFEALRDGIVVVDRCHGPDPRLEDWPGELHPGASAERASNARLCLAAYAAGLQLARGSDARELLGLVPDGQPGDIEGEGLAAILFEAIALGRGEPQAAWSTFPTEIHSHLHAFVRAMAKKVDDNWLEYTTTAELERLMVQQAPADASRIGQTQLRRIQIGKAPDDIELEPDAARLVLQLLDDEKAIGTVVLPAFDEVLPGRVAADAVLTNDHCWNVLRRVTERVSRDLAVTRADGRLIVRRADTILADVDDDPRAEAGEAVHNEAGWTIFLQELWGLPAWRGAEFYEPTDRRTHEPAGPPQDATGSPVVVEIANPLPKIISHAPAIDGAIDIYIEARLAGLPLLALRIPTVDGVLDPDRLRRAITLVGKYELCRVAVREAILLADWPEAMTLRGWLQELAAGRSQVVQSAGPSNGAGALDARRSALLTEWLPPGRRATVIGRRITDRVVGTASRAASFPYATRDLMATLAQDGNQLVVESGTEELPGIGLYAPWLFDPSESAIRFDPDDDHLTREFDEAFANDADPWDYTSAYEQHKYDDTLALIPDHAEIAIEVGCAEGIFTRQLAGRVGRLTAIDISGLGLTRAKRRCADLANVEYRRQNLFTEPLPGGADLIVCSELLYFARDWSELAVGVRTLVDALKPGGLLITTHVNAVVDDPDAPGFDWDVPFGAAGIERALLTDRRLILTRERIAPMYRAQAYRRVRKARRLLRSATHARVSERSVGVPELTPPVARHFLPEGGTVRRDTSPTMTDHLPILMYHRIASDSVPENRRWTTTPEEFEQQLAWLDEHHYSSVSIDEWAAAAAEDLPMHGRRVILTFDDGYQDFADHACPLLEEYGFRAELFIVTGRVGATNDWERLAAPRYRLMDWSTIDALPRRTVRIGSHTETHPLLTALPAHTVVEELARSRITLEDRLGRRISSIAYPYGPADGALTHLAGAAGYEYGYTTHGGHASRGPELLALPRLEIRGDQPIDSFARLVAGGHTDG